jgi:hypothetical protein
VAGLWHEDETGDWIESVVPDHTRYIRVEPMHADAGLAPMLTARKRINPGSRLRGTENVWFLIRTGMANAENWFVLPGPAAQLRLNGIPVTTGMARLVDKDVLAFAANPAEWVFTTERFAAIGTYEDAAGLFCPRCKLPLDPGQKVVACPSCRVIHHQDESIEKLCWTYSDGCANCYRGTNLTNPTYSWTPNAL